MTAVSTISAPVRHPLDPEPVRCTKAVAVHALGVLALVTGPLVGGIVPAVIALVLARQARADLTAARGYLTGGDKLRQGELFALVGLGLAVVTLVVAAIAAVLSSVTSAGHNFPDTMN